MVQLLAEELQVQLQANLNCLELCSALYKQTDEPGVKEALVALIDDLQESLASLARHLRQRGVAPGGYELDRQGKAQIREVLGIPSLPEKLLVVRRSLAGLVAWYAEHLTAERSDPGDWDWLVSLSARAQRMLAEWDQKMREIKAMPF